MTWRLPPEDWAALRDQCVLWLSDAECCARVIAGERGDLSAEFMRISTTTVPARIAEALRLHNCPEEALERAGNEVLLKALEWRDQRDAMLSASVTRREVH